MIASLGLGGILELPFDTSTTRSCSSGWRMEDPSSIAQPFSASPSRDRAARAALRVRAQL